MQDEKMSAATPLKGGVLAAVGQLPQDEAVLARAIEVAADSGVSLTVVHVLDVAMTDWMAPDVTTLRHQAELSVRDDIVAALARLGADESATVLIEVGTPSARLLEVCEERRPGLIVMRAHENPRIVEKLLGSTTDRVIHLARAPVLVIKRPVERPYRRALVATDGTDEAALAMSFVANALPKAVLYLVQAVHIPQQLKSAMLRAGEGQGAITAHREAMEQRAADYLHGLARGLDRAQPAVTTRVLSGDPAFCLVRATRSPKVDVMVVGPGRTNIIRRALIGSVTRKLIRDAACDVLVYRVDE
ncbi:universal stress protein [Phaeovulum sp.]|uniref:universal stress protein n=1 Tax=Phaeovulum sp. TaxID=2934796 RepID=UPI0039E3D0AA